MNFTTIEYPKCPYCLIVINDISIFSLQHLRSNHYDKANCPSCNKDFFLAVRIYLNSDAIKVEEI